MVLESVFVDVLNTFLGEYVESVDAIKLSNIFGKWQNLVSFLYNFNRLKFHMPLAINLKKYTQVII
jgi:hypothetical protein